MLPAVRLMPTIAADLQEVSRPGALRAQPSANVPALLPEDDAALPLSGSRLSALSLSAQLQLGHSFSIVAETIGRLLDLPRGENETVLDYSARLAQAVQALPAAERRAVERLLSQIARSIPLDLLVQLLEDPAGPVAARLAVLIEAHAPANRDLAAKAAIGFYRQNEGMVLPSRPAPSPASSGQAPPAAPSTTPGVATGQTSGATPVHPAAQASAQTAQAPQISTPAPDRPAAPMRTADQPQGVLQEPDGAAPARPAAPTEALLLRGQAPSGSLPQTPSPSPNTGSQIPPPSSAPNPASSPTAAPAAQTGLPSSAQPAQYGSDTFPLPVLPDAGSQPASRSASPAPAPESPVGGKAHASAAHPEEDAPVARPQDPVRPALDGPPRSADVRPVNGAAALVARLAQLLAGAGSSVAPPPPAAAALPAADDPAADPMPRHDPISMTERERMAAAHAPAGLAADADGEINRIPNPPSASSAVASNAADPADLTSLPLPSAWVPAPRDGIPWTQVPYPPADEEPRREERKARAIDALGDEDEDAPAGDQGLHQQQQEAEEDTKEGGQETVQEDDPRKNANPKDIDDQSVSEAGEPGEYYWRMAGWR